MTRTSALREIDRVVDQTIRDKSRAAKLKHALHQQYDLTRPGTHDQTESMRSVSDEAEEFWDNVPV